MMGMAENPSADLSNPPVPPSFPAQHAGLTIVRCAGLKQDATVIINSLGPDREGGGRLTGVAAVGILQI